ncbi:nitrate reductase [Alkalilimnicola ehrlichii]|uniref:nitrate reductase n=1 Tax=Alkalilimnicola ehrlichii TaxID=351052 RepID=UPI000E2E76E8|nr:nitrate reductase [Alkalilimnicola ehrlichii]RFA30774.1 nitrate reductase [Alkalilimnicola ehrlichii]
MSTQTTATTCPYCGVGCGVLVDRDAAGTVSVRGNPEHPANFGRLCSKGSALAETLGLEGRLLTPEVNGQACDWDQALDTVASGFRRIIDEYGPDAVAIYGSGQLLTEDYYVANKLMKGFIGSPNIDTNSRLCMASAVVGHKRAFGADAVPVCYEDLELADLVVLTGSNLAWCHPVLFQRLRAAREQNPNLKVVVIDPRRTDSCDIADLHLPLRPGSDIALFNGLLTHLSRYGKVDYRFLEQHGNGFSDALEAAEQSGSLPETAFLCGLPEQDVLQFFRWFAATEKTVTVFSQGINQSSVGTDKVNAIVNCHLLTGRIGRPGMGPFSITGQPNAMGGREVGGLANQLAAHMDFTPEDIDRVRRFWDAPNIADKPGLKAVDMFEAIGRGEIKAVWIMATNPAVSLPDADKVRAALAGCELVVVSDCMRETDTARLATVRLPALTWGEKDGTVTNSERRISRQRRFLPAPGAARADWWIICEVAKRLGFAEAFDYVAPCEIFREHARLSGFENGGRRAFDIGALAEISAAEYEALTPFQWPRPAGSRTGQTRLYGEGGFHTPSGRAQLVPVSHQAPQNAPNPDYPLILNTGRVRDHWHTLTRTGKAPRLCAHMPEPLAQIHPSDAYRLGLLEGDLVSIESLWGKAVVRLRLDEQQQEGCVFVPMHWNDSFSAQACIDAVVNPARDPLSGEPEFKHTPVKVQSCRYQWHGFCLSRETVSPIGDYWTQLPVVNGQRLEFACSEGVDWHSWAQAQAPAEVEWLEFKDPGRGLFRLAAVQDNRLAFCLFIGPEPNLPEREWLTTLLSADSLSVNERLALLSGAPPAGTGSQGRTVCSCFGVGENTICAAVRAGCHSAKEITRQLKAGGNCGSCLPEIERLIAENKRERAA